MVEGVRRKFSLNYLGGGPAQAELLTTLTQLEITACIYVCPDLLLANPMPWHSAVARGFRLSNGCLLGATTDGSLPLWNFEMLTEEMVQCDRFLRDFGIDDVSAVFLPGSERVCHQGDYSPLLKQRYAYGLTTAGDSWPTSDHAVVTVSPRIVNYFDNFEDLPVVTHFVIPSSGLNPMPESLSASHEWLLHQLAMRSDSIDVIQFGQPLRIVRGSE